MERWVIRELSRGGLVRAISIGALAVTIVLIVASLPGSAGAPQLSLKPAYGGGCTGPPSPTGVNTFTTTGYYSDSLATPALSNGGIASSNTTAVSSNPAHQVASEVAAQQFFIVGCYEHNATNQNIEFWANWSVTFDSSVTYGSSTSCRGAGTQALAELDVVAAVHSASSPYYHPSNRPHSVAVVNTGTGLSPCANKYLNSTGGFSVAIEVSTTVTGGSAYDFYTGINDTVSAQMMGTPTGSVTSALSWNATLQTVQCVCP